MFYLIRMPRLLKKLYPAYTWDIPGREKILYLSFDDGPHPVATPFVLDTLQKFGAKATFFCIGKNVIANPELYRRLINEGHRVGNHTQNHLNGWKTPAGQYLQNVRDAAGAIDSHLFRPPYGRITRLQAAGLASMPVPFKIIMWDVLSGDFDRKISGKRCASHVISKARKGSIIVFHDSEKAFERMSFALPEILHHFCGLGYRFETIPR